MDYLLKEIDVFVKIIEHGSFKAAAEELHLSQSAMTQRLKKLEDALGVRLIERTTRTISPTVVGHSFLPIAKRMLLQFNQSLTDLMDLVHGNAGQVTISSLISVATYILPTALGRFALQNPNVRIRVFDDAEREIAARVRRAEAEFGIDMDTAQAEPDLEITPVLDDPYVLICREDHGVAIDGPVTLGELTEMPLITLGARSGTNQLILSHLADVSRSGAWRHEVQHLSTLVGMVEAGVGVGIVPMMAIRNRIGHTIIHRRILDPRLTRTIVFVQRRAVELSPAAETFKGILLDTFDGLRTAS